MSVLVSTIIKLVVAEVLIQTWALDGFFPRVAILDISIAWPKYLKYFFRVCPTVANGFLKWENQRRTIFLHKCQFLFASEKSLQLMCSFCLRCRIFLQKRTHQPYKNLHSPDKSALAKHA